MKDKNVIKNRGQGACFETVGGVVLGLFLRSLLKKENRNFLKIELMELNVKDILKSCIRKQKNTP